MSQTFSCFYVCDRRRLRLQKGLQGQFRESPSFVFRRPDEDLQPVIPSSSPVYFAKTGGGPSVSLYDNGLAFDNPAYASTTDVHRGRHAPPPPPDFDVKEDALADGDVPTYPGAGDSSKDKSIFGGSLFRRENGAKLVLDAKTTRGSEAHSFA